MLPWNYGFHWNLGTLFFLGAFYTVLSVVATTVIVAALRSRRELAAHQEESIRWHSDFHDLPAADRVCRHVLTGELRRRECPHAFDCRECETHANLIARHPLPASPETEEDIFGMSFPLDRFYHRGHTWARKEADGTVTIGLDDLGKRLLGAPEDVRLPQAGARIQTNGTAFHVSKRNADIAVLAPVDGEVVETGGPKDEWYLRVRPEAASELAFRHLLRGAEIRPWLLRSGGLQFALTAEGAAPTLADGGVPVADIAASYPQADWDAVCGRDVSAAVKCGADRARRPSPRSEGPGCGHGGLTEPGLGHAVVFLHPQVGPYRRRTALLRSNERRRYDHLSVAPGLHAFVLGGTKSGGSAAPSPKK